LIHQLIEAISQHEKTPVAALIKLAHYYRDRHANFECFCPLITNPNTPTEALEILIHELFSQQYNIFRISKFLSHPNVSVKILVEIANHDSPSVRAALANAKIVKRVQSCE
jgi:hypothetical protein